MTGPSKKKSIGQRRPPREGLVGRTEACRILGCDSRQFRRYVGDGTVPLAEVETDAEGRLEARWYDIKTIRDLAAKMRRWRKQALRRGRRVGARNAVTAAAGTAKTRRRSDYRPEADEYRPEPRLPAILTSRAAAPSIVDDPSKTRERTSVSHGSDGAASAFRQVPANWLTDPEPSDDIPPPRWLDEDEPPSSRTGT
jgi:hypothetical protein